MNKAQLIEAIANEINVTKATAAMRTSSQAPVNIMMYAVGKSMILKHSHILSINSIMI